MELYHLQTRAWSFLPDLQVARSGASSCCHGSYIYIFGGLTADGNTNKIERLSLSGFDSVWELIEPTESQLQPRFNSAMVSYSDTKFIILGGVSNSGPLGDVTVHSTANESLDGIMQPTTIVKNNATGHTKF